MIRTAIFSTTTLVRHRITLLRATLSTQDQEWRKHQLDKLSKKFQEPKEINNDEDLQPMWKDMESRVTRRRTYTKQEAGGKVGRRNIRPTDEEAWLQAGLYSDDEEGDDGGGEDEEEEKK